MTEYTLTLQAHDLFTNIWDDWGHTHTRTITHKHTHAPAAQSHSIPALWPDHVTWAVRLKSIILLLRWCYVDHMITRRPQVIRSLLFVALWNHRLCFFFHPPNSSTPHIYLFCRCSGVYSHLFKTKINVVVKKKQLTKVPVHIGTGPHSAHINVFVHFDGETPKGVRHIK